MSGETTQKNEASPSGDAPLPTRYDPRAHEAAVYERWERAGAFRADPASGRAPYTIVIPPPNVTGTLHIGHALNNSLQDLLIRWRRMQGREALWLPGTDHAGIATQYVVEKQIAKAEGKTRYQLGREELIKRIWAWRERSGGLILKQLRKLGASCDWSRTRFTLDEGLSRAVREAFVRLYEQKLLYRGKYLVNWCPRCLTTLSDDEVTHREVAGKLYELHYPLADDPQKHLTVATTRPETMLGDAAVAVHPDDERYRAFIGKKLRLPLAEREIPVIADTAIDLAYGSGCLKVTPAHDPVDYEIGRRHGLEPLNIFTEEGKLNDQAPEAFRGLERFQARRAVLEALEALGLTGQVTPNPHQVGHCYRCGTMIEPYLTAQWFVNMKPLSKLAVEASRSGRVRFHPERWTKVYRHWFEEVRDWPVSRQIWWGHRIPVWYCLEDNRGAITRIEARPDEPCESEEGGKRWRYLIGEHARPIVSREDPAQRPEYRGKTLIRDPDVLDTWFSSALWPFSTMGWPEETPDLAAFYPTETLVTGRDIIYFWVARMVMMGEFLMKKEPFAHVVIHGTVLDGEGAVMSKSKGNSVDPLDIIARYGADAMRFTLFDMATEGQDLKLPVLILCPHCGEPNALPAKRTRPTLACRKCRQAFQQPVPNEAPLAEPPMGRLDSKRFEKGRNFANKVWNAARFVLQACAEPDAGGTSGAIEARLKDQDRWILSRLNRTIEALSRALEQFAFSRAANVLYAFFWDDFCAWTIELSKPRLDERAAPEDRAVARAVLLHVLDRSLRLLHPFCPFISETLWAELNRCAPQPERRNLGRAAGAEGTVETKALLAVSGWPEVERAWLDERLETQFESLFEAVRAVRNIRQKNGIGFHERLKVFIKTADAGTAERLRAQQHILVRMAGIEAPEIGPEVSKPKPAGTEVLAGAELYVALAGLIDTQREQARLEKEIQRAENALRQSEKKLANEKFVKNAPAEKVDAERARLREYRQKHVSLKAALAELND